jgi:microcystin-dependent protein
MIFPDPPGSPFFRPSQGDLPVGSVTAFAGPLSMSGMDQGGSSLLEAWGWMFCDGRALACSQYPELFTVLGYVYGGAGDQFHIPDYRGYFLRGVGAGTDNDPDRATRTRPPGGQGLSDGVGSLQSCALQVHEHAYQSAPAPAAVSQSGSASGAASVQQTLTEGGPVPGKGQSAAVEVSQAETRPLNVYVNYIIKFTYGSHRFME